MCSEFCTLLKVNSVLVETNFANVQNFVHCLRLIAC
nr:MAG TPA: hypothetical protein [Caudoviricetes sp.]